MIEYTSTFFQKVPKYLLEKRSQIIMVLFVSIFAVVFINIFQPFGSDKWIDNDKITTTIYFLWSIVLVSIGMIVIYVNAIKNTVCILFIPYIICILYFSYQNNKLKLRELMGENIGFKSSNLISIRDSRGVLQLSVAKENLLYIESADNYICIWYQKGETLKKKLMRITMKEISEQLADTNIVRCHRSYMINLDLVKVMRREKENIFLELGVPNVKEIPISKTYGESVLRRLVPVS